MIQNMACRILSEDPMFDDESEKKPPVPYIKDWKFTVQQHNAPPFTKPTSGGCTVEDIGETNRLNSSNQLNDASKIPPEKDHMAH